MALVEAGREAEGQRLASIAAPVVLEYAGPKGHRSVSGKAVLLLALSGDVDGAIRYAEQIGPDKFEMFGRGLRAASLGINALAENARWQRFLEECERRQMEEVARFDQLVASGEIVMP